MKLIVYTKYGSPNVLKLKDVARPDPLDDEVLVEIHAASVNAYDWHFLTADVFLIRLMSGGSAETQKDHTGCRYRRESYCSWQRYPEIPGWGRCIWDYKRWQWWVC